MSEYLKNIESESEEKAEKLLEKLAEDNANSKMFGKTYIVTEALKDLAIEAYEAGAREVPIKAAELKKLYEEFKKSGSAEWIGEDGDAVCIATTAGGALRKFKKLMRDDVGDWEADEMKLEQVSIGYMHLPDPEDYNPDECEWYVHYKPESKNQYEMFVYRA